MPSIISYYEGQELPDLSLELLDSDGDIIDFSDGYTFSVKIGVPGSAAELSKTSGIDGAATTPNVVVTWDAGELDGLSPARLYTLQLACVRTSDTKTYMYQFQFRQAPAVL